MEGSRLAVYTAIGANIAIAITKFIVANVAAVTPESREFILKLHQQRRCHKGPDSSSNQRDNC